MILDAVSVAGAAAVALAHARLMMDAPPERIALKSLALTIRCAGVALWPAFITRLCPDAQNVLPGTAWLLAFQIMDALVLTDARAKQGLQVEKANFLGVAFALAALSGNRPEGAHAQLFVYATLGMFLAVVPTHDMQERTRVSVAIDNVQKVVLNYCIAIFVTAVARTRASACA